MRVEDTTARTDDETGTLTVPSQILPPRSAPGKNHDNSSLIQSCTSLTALQDTSSVPPTARQSVWQQAQKRVFMEKDCNSCRGDKPALPPTSAIPCHAVRKQSCQVRSTATSNALVMQCVSCLVSVSNVQ